MAGGASAHDVVSFERERRRQYLSRLVATTRSEGSEDGDHRGSVQEET